MAARSSSVQRRSGPPIIRFAHALALVDFLKCIGAPTGRHLRRSGLPVYCDDPDALVPRHFVFEFFNCVANDVDPEIGWRVGSFVGYRALNTALSHRARHAPTLYRGLFELARHATSEASSLALDISERPHRVDLRTSCVGSSGKTQNGCRPMQDYQLMVLLSIIRYYLGSTWVPLVVGVTGKSVPETAASVFSSLRVRVHQEAIFIGIDRGSLATPAPAVITKPSRESSIESLSELAYEDKLRELLRPYLSEGYPSTLFAATLMGTSTRTLARKLDAVKLSYRQIIDELRFHEALKMLAESTHCISDVSYAVGFDDPAHFTRMFRRVSGMTPRDYRSSMH